MKATRWAALLGVLLLTFTESGRANMGDTFGVGSRGAALGASTVSWATDGYATYINPAALASPERKRITLSWGLMIMEPWFTPISGVVVENSYTSDKETVGDVDNSYRATFGQALGLTYQLFPEKGRLTAGILTFLPLDSLSYIDTGESFVPEYVLYRARTQHPQIDVALGGAPAENFYVGGGAHIGFTLTSLATVFLQTDATKPSTMRFEGALKPKAAPYLGFLYGQGAEAPGDFAIGLVARTHLKASNTLVLKSGARVFGNFAAVDFNFEALSAMFYDPYALEWGASYQISEKLRQYVQADFQAWKLFEAPALAVQEPKTTCTQIGSTSCGVAISSGKNPPLPLRNTWTIRAGQEWKLDPETIVRVGYGYKPSVFSELPTGAGNYLDPPKHMINAGVGFKFDDIQVDVHASYHALVSQSVTKTAGDELDNPSNRKIGAPGYTAGGRVFGGGATVTLAL